MNRENEVEEEDEENFLPDNSNHELTKQKLKTATNYFVSKISEEECKKNNPFHQKMSKQVVAAISELVYDFAESLGTDLEAFARHAKRSTITMDEYLI